MVCTFTRKAALELRDRLVRYGVPVSTPGGPGGTPSPGVRAGTLHQLGLTLLRRRAADTGRPPPALVEHRWRTLAELAGDRAVASVADTEIGWAKARCLTPEDYRGPPAAGAPLRGAGRDRRGLRRATRTAWPGAACSTSTTSCWRPATSCCDDPVAADAARWRYRHVAVDEFQDVNPAQFRLVEALLGDRADLCAVGDPNQAIYGWNGADPGPAGLAPRPRWPGSRSCTWTGTTAAPPRSWPSPRPPSGRRRSPLPPRPPTTGPMPTVTAFDDDRAEAEAVAAADPGAGRGRHGLVRPGGPGPHPRPAGRGPSGARRRRHPLPVRPRPRVGGDRGLGAGQWTGRGTAPASGRGRSRRGGRAGHVPSGQGPRVGRGSVVGLEEGFVPIIHAATPAAVAEERRLLYVALTRAGPHTRVLVGPDAGPWAAGGPWRAARRRGWTTSPTRARRVSNGRRRRTPPTGSPRSGPTSAADLGHPPSSFIAVQPLAHPGRVPAERTEEPCAYRSTY